MSVLELNLGYTVKYNPRALSSGTPSGKGFYLTVYPLPRPNTDTIFVGHYGIYYSSFSNVGELFGGGYVISRLPSLVLLASINI